MPLDVPSRYSNPFATCWTRPEALPFVFSPGQSAPQLVAALAAANWRGEIVGPHGSGKSTLLKTLQPHLVAAGRSFTAFTLRKAQRRLPWNQLGASLASLRPLVIVDGYEQLSLLARARLHWRCRRASAGLLITSHRATGLPRLATLAPSLELAKRLVAELTRRVASPVTESDVAAAYASHGSNLRALFFDLYARHERYRRLARTEPASVA